MVSAMNREKIGDLFRQAGFAPDHEQTARFEKFGYELLEWNRKMNLTALTDDEGIVVKHFLDSLLAVRSEYWSGRGALLDLGTGAGFPGVPLKIMHPQLRVVLADSLQKRIRFLEHIIAELQLQGIEARHGRAEELGRNALFREKFDYVASRAVAKMPVLLEYCLPFLRIGGYFFAYKGPTGREELEEAQKALALLGGKPVEIREYSLLGGQGERTIIVIEKTRASEMQYPRKPGVPEKRPL